MDDKTFNELIKKGELSLILMDGGADLTPQQMAKVKKTAADLSDARLEEMAVELAGTPGYMEFMMLPLMSKIVGNTFKKTTQEKPNQTKEQKANTSVKEESKEKPVGKKDPQLNTIAPTAEIKLKPGDSEGDILGKIFNLMVKSYHERDAEFKEETKYKENLAEKKEERSKELIGLFGGKQKKPPKKEPKEKKEKPKKESGKTAEPAPKNVTRSVSTAVKVTTGAAAAGAAVYGVDALAAKITKNEGGGNPNQANIVKGHSTKEAQIVKGNVDVTTGVTFSKSLEEMTLGEAVDLGNRRSKYYNAKGAGAALGKYGFMPIAIEDRGRALYGKDWRNVPFDSKTQDELNKSLISANLEKLQKAGIPPSEKNLYLMHFFGNTTQTSAFLNSSDESSMRPILDIYNHGSTANPDVAKLTVGEYKKRFLAKFDDTPANLQKNSLSSTPAAQMAPIVPTTIPSKIPTEQSSTAPSATFMQQNTNIIKGGTTYSIIEEIVSDYPAFLQKQFNLA